MKASNCLIQFCFIVINFLFKWLQFMSREELFASNKLKLYNISIIIYKSLI